MKSRVTLTLDPVISHRAKAVARARGTSVSGLVEHLLAEAIEPGKTSGHGEGFSARWAGRLRVADKDDARARRLRRKHGL